MQAPVSAPGAPTFVRLLARIAEVPALPPVLPTAHQLGEWIGWPQAVTLSRALDDAPEATDPPAPASAENLAAECTRIRAELAGTIDAGPAGTDPAAFQQHAQAMQRAMQTSTGHLRGELRELLAAGTPQQARLAEVDAAMEAALSPREHALLAPVCALLGERLERLHQAGQATGTADTIPAARPDPDPPAWIPAFRNELRDLLQAELDLRFHPIEGLLAALRSC